MLHNFYDKLTGINLATWVVAYIALIALYTQLPEAVWSVRPVLSIIAQLMIVVILIAAIDKIRQV